MPRRSAHCAFRRTLLCLVSRDRLLWFFEFTSPSESGDQSEYGCDRGLVFSASASGVDSRRSSVVATLRSCRRCGCVPRGQRALLDADMLEFIDRSACLVEPVVVESCAPSVLVLSPAASTSSAASDRCSRIPPPRGLVEGLLLPGLLTPSCSCHFTATLGSEKSWMISSLKRDSTLLSFLVCLLAPLVIMLKTSSTLCALWTLLTGLPVLNRFILHSETERVLVQTNPFVLPDTAHGIMVKKSCCHR